MLRRLLAIFFLLANLTTQVSVAFACGMMGDAPVVLKHCCCHPGQAVAPCDKAMSGKGCCQQVVEVSAGASDEVGNLHAATKVPDYNPQPLPPALLPVLFAIVAPSQSQELNWDGARDHSLHGTDLYLHTQRLRL